MRKVLEFIGCLVVAVIGAVLLLLYAVAGIIAELVGLFVDANGRGRSK